MPVTPFSLCSHHGIIMKFVYQWQKWCLCKSSRSEVKTQINNFGTITPVWFHIWWWNDAQSLILFRSGALLIFKVIYQISSHTAKKNHQFRPKLGVFGLYLQFEFTDGYEMMHKDWSSIEEVPYCLSRLSVKFQGHRAKKYQFWPKIGIFRTVTQVRIHRWLWNDAQILK